MAAATLPASAAATTLIEDTSSPAARLGGAQNDTARRSVRVRKSKLRVPADAVEVGQQEIRGGRRRDTEEWCCRRPPAGPSA